MSPSYQSETQSLKMKPRELPTIGPFRAIDILGQGAMGIVYLAEQTAPIRRRVALKVVRVGMDSKEVVARFERERQALALMDHANVARVFDAGESDDGRPYFAMEYVPGLPITKFCDQHKMPNRRRLELFAEVCDAVEHAHQKGVIHRDIKPSNVLVGGTAERPGPKVIDFGVAKSIGRLIVDDTFATQIGQFVGTPAYMSPEQAGFGHVEIDHRTDVYSLGMLLYEMLVGVLPFDFRDLLNKTLVQVQQFILDRDPMPPSTRLSKLGDEADAYAALRQTDRTHLLREIRGELDWILAKALEKDRNRRYRTVFDLATDVRHYLACEPLSVGPPTILYRAAKFVRRRQRAIAIYGLLATASLSAIAAGASIWRSHELQKDAIRADYLEAQMAGFSNPQDAIDRLTRLVSEYPDYQEARVDLAYLLHRENDTTGSIRVAEQLLEQNPSNGPAHLLLALIYRQTDPEQAEEHLQQGRQSVPDDRYFAALALPWSESTKAVSLLTDLLRKDGTNFNFRWARAWRYFELGQYDKMLDDADFLTKSREESATAWNAHGVALSRMNRLQEAYASFSRAIELKRDYAPTYLNRAKVHLAQGKPNLALADCNSAVQLNEGFADAYANRAWAHLAENRMTDAMADCERSLSLKSRNSLAHQCRSRIYRRQNDLAHALKEIGLAISGDARNPELLIDRAQLALRVDDLDLALTDLTRAVDLRPEMPTYYRMRARVHRWRGEYKQALVDDDRAVALNPGDLTSHASRGINRWLAGDLTGAIEDFEHAAPETPGQAIAPLLWIWEIQLMLEDQDAAMDALDRAQRVVRSEWENHLLAIVRGSEPEETLLSRAVDAPRKCETYYYLAARAYSQRHVDQAMHWFGECVRLGYKDYDEYDLAQGRLAQARAQPLQERGGH